MSIVQLPDRGVRGTRSVGLLCGGAADPYSMAVAKGAGERLIQAGVHALCFSGGFPDSPLFRSADSETPRLPACDGAIALTATMRGADKELEAIARSGKPFVSIGVQYNDVPSVAINDEIGVFRAIGHLTKRHQRARIAFIGGPEDSLDGERRLAAYRLGLQNFGLHSDPAMVVRGDYEAASGREAALQLRRYGKRSFDAIVAANDLMAIGAIEGLRNLGLRVPEDVAVIGFDDSEEASFTDPPLTTIRQPVAEQGGLAADLMLARLAGEEVDVSPSMVAPPLVIRRSCGCDEERHSYRGPAADTDQVLVEDALRGTVGRHLAYARRRRELTGIAEGMLSAVSVPALASVMTEAFRLVAARRLLLCTYDAELKNVRVTLESSGRNVAVRGTSPGFSTAQLLPAGFLRANDATQVFIMPLRLGCEHFGYLVIESEFGDGLQFELPHYLGATLARLARERELRSLYAATRPSGDPGAGQSRGPSVPPPAKLPAIP